MINLPSCFPQYYEVQLGSNLGSHSMDRRTLVPTNWAPSNFSDVVFVWKFPDMMWGQRVPLINFVDPAKHLLGLPQAQALCSITRIDSGHCPIWRVATSCDQTKLDPLPTGGVWPVWCLFHLLLICHLFRTAATRSSSPPTLPEPHSHSYTPALIPFVAPNCTEGLTFVLE